MINNTSHSASHSTEHGLSTAETKPCITFMKASITQDKDRVCNEFLENIRFWYEGSEYLPRMDDWNDRREKTFCITKDFRDTKGGIIYGLYQDTVVALMNYDTPVTGQPLFINGLVTHPGSSGLGGLCLEKALEDSRNRAGGTDTIALETWADSSSERQYKALGMTRETKGLVNSRDLVTMKLDPEQSVRWQLIKGKWRIFCT